MEVAHQKVQCTERQDSSPGQELKRLGSFSDQAVSLEEPRKGIQTGRREPKNRAPLLSTGICSEDL